MTQIVESSHDDLTRYHRKAVRVVKGMFTLTLLLTALAFAGVRLAPLPGLSDPAIAIALWISILVFGLGAVALRRTRFAAMRLQDIASLEGTLGLLATLQKTTVLVALLGGAIALMGFIITMMTSERLDMLRAGLIAIAVLLYCYPRRAAWQRVVQATQQPDGLTTSAAKGKIA